MSDIILRFVRTHGVNIISDGDLDGVFATGFILRALIRLDIDVVYDGKVYYPRARELEKMEARGNILIELRSDRGIKYRGQNLLIDHHPEPPRIVLYSEESPILIRKYSVSTSVAGLIHYVFRDNLDVPEELVDVVDQVDYKNYEIEDARRLARAFILSRNMPNDSLRDIFDTTLAQLKDKPLFRNLEQLASKSPIYGFLTLAIAMGDWNSIYDWIDREAERYERQIISTAKKLYNRATRSKNLSYIIYNYGNIKERTAVDDVFYALQRESRIAMMIGVTTNGFLIRIASFDPNLNLAKICADLSDRRVKCGGRENVVGLYFPNTFFTLTDVLKITRQLIDRILS